jgi:hypothetical protein
VSAEKAGSISIQPSDASSQCPIDVLTERHERARVARPVFGSTLHAVSALRERYQVSREAVVRPRSFRGMDDAPQPMLRIAYAVPSERFTVFLPPHKSIPDTSCVYRALETGEVETAEESWGVVGLPTCRVEAMPMPPGDDAEASLRAVAFPWGERPRSR